METQEPFSPLRPQQLDPEAFRRVWARVMPNQEESPIALSPPHRPARPRSAAPPQPEVPAPQQLLEELNLALFQARQLARRTGSPALHQLTRLRQQDMRRLSTAWFLATGRQYRSRTQFPAPRRDLPQALREQFLWEQKWTRDTLSAARDVRDPALAQQLRELSQNARPRLDLIRLLLEQL